MKPCQKTQDQNEAQAHVLADIGRAVLANPFGIEKDEEDDTKDTEDNGPKLLEVITRDLGISRKSAAVALPRDHRADVLGICQCRIENDRDHLGGIVCLDMLHAGELAHGVFDNMFAT